MPLTPGKIPKALDGASVQDGFDAVGLRDKDNAQTDALPTEKSVADALYDKFGIVNAFYKFSSNTDSSDPTSGYIKFNPDRSLLFVSKTDDRGTSVDNYWSVMDENNTLTIQASADKQVVITIDGPKQDLGTWYSIPVVVTVDGASFVDQDECFLGFGLAAGGIQEAPIDGKTYGRKDAAWAEVTGGGGGGLEPSVIRTGSFKLAAAQTGISTGDAVELVLLDASDVPQWNNTTHQGTLQAGESAILASNVYITSGNSGNRAQYAWYNVTDDELLGNSARVLGNNYSTNDGSSGGATASFTATKETVIELRLIFVGVGDGVANLNAALTGGSITIIEQVAAVTTTNVVHETVLGSASNTIDIDISTLDLVEANVFDIKLEVPAAPIPSSVALYYNGDYLDANYNRQLLRSYDSTTQANNSDIAAIGRIGDGTSSTVTASVTAFEGTVRTHADSISRDGVGIAYLGIIEQYSTASINAVTSIRLTSTAPSAVFPIGTKVQIIDPRLVSVGGSGGGGGDPVELENLTLTLSGAGAQSIPNGTNEVLEYATEDNNASEYMKVNNLGTSNLEIEFLKDCTVDINTKGVGESATFTLGLNTHAQAGYLLNTVLGDLQMNMLSQGDTNRLPFNYSGLGKKFVAGDKIQPYVLNSTGATTTLSTSITAPYTTLRVLNVEGTGGGGSGPVTVKIRDVYEVPADTDSVSFDLTGWERAKITYEGEAPQSGVIGMTINGDSVGTQYNTVQCLTAVGAGNPVLSSNNTPFYISPTVGKPYCVETVVTPTVTTYTTGEEDVAGLVTRSGIVTYNGGASDLGIVEFFGDGGANLFNAGMKFTIERLDIEELEGTGSGGGGGEGPVIAQGQFYWDGANVVSTSLVGVSSIVRLQQGRFQVNLADTQSSAYFPALASADTRGTSVNYVAGTYPDTESSFIINYEDGNGAGFDPTTISRVSFTAHDPDWDGKYSGGGGSAPIRVIDNQERLVENLYWQDPDNLGDYYQVYEKRVYQTSAATGDWEDIPHGIANLNLLMVTHQAFLTPYNTPGVYTEVLDVAYAPDVTDLNRITKRLTTTNVGVDNELGYSAARITHTLQFCKTTDTPIPNPLP